VKLLDKLLRQKINEHLNKTLISGIQNKLQQYSNVTGADNLSPDGRGAAQQ
jgi:hypothetical protein